MSPRKRQHGGPRSGKPGAAYGNRTDLNAKPRQAVTAAAGQTYGERGVQEAAQQAIPLPAPVVPLSAPTQRPNEPVTAGLPIGPGPGPEALAPMGAPPADAPVLELLQALYAQYPNNELRGLIEEAEFLR